MSPLKTQLPIILIVIGAVVVACALGYGAPVWLAGVLTFVFLLLATVARRAVEPAGEPAEELRDELEELRESQRI